MVKRDSHGRFIKGTEQICKTSGFKKGHVSWLKGTKGLVKSNSGSFKKDEWCGYGFSKGHIPWNKDLKGYNAKEKSPHWKGGITDLYHKIRNKTRSIENLWRKIIFAGDNYTCQMCEQKGGKLIAHHVFGWKRFPERRFSLCNGLTLCFECHKTTNNYCGRGR